jgi:hypothetical protein
MTDKERIEQAVEQAGFSVKSWNPDHENGLTANIGKFTVMSNDEEDYGLYEGDEGTLYACVVGAEQYGNQRVSFSFITEGYDDGNEVHDLSVLDPSDDF